MSTPEQMVDAALCARAERAEAEVAALKEDKARGKFRTKPTKFEEEVI
jgi:hypothetical protein